MCKELKVFSSDLTRNLPSLFATSLKSENSGWKKEKPGADRSNRLKFMFTNFLILDWGGLIATKNITTQGSTT